MYTPIRTDEENIGIDRIAFGGINVYLQQHSALFRHTPWFLDRLLDRPGLLRMATQPQRQRQAGALGALDRLDARRRAWPPAEGIGKTGAMAGRDIRPDMVHLNNILLIGIAREITAGWAAGGVQSVRRRSLSGKAARAASQPSTRPAARSGAAEVAALVAMNGYYAGFMAEYLVCRAADQRDPAGAQLGRSWNATGQTSTSLPSASSPASVPKRACTS